MRKSRRLVSMAAGAAALSVFSPVSKAAAFNWTSTSGGTYDWTVAGNWGGAGHPTGASGAGDSANILINATGTVNIAVPTGSYFVSNLTLGSSGSPQTIDVGNGNSGGGTLVMDGGVPSSSPFVYGDIVSGGVAGSTNIISANLQVDQFPFYSGDLNSGAGGVNPTTVGNYLIHNQFGTVSSQFTRNDLDTGIFASVLVDPTSTNSLTLNGTISQTASLGTGGTAGFLTNAMPAGQTLTINGGITITDPASTGTQTFSITGTNGSTTIINGVISDGGNGTTRGSMTYGNSNGNKTTIYPAPSPTIIINSANTYTGITTIAMSTLVLANNQAFGPQPAGSLPTTSVGEVRMGGTANEYGYNLISTDDARTIANGMAVGELLTIEGSHSLTLNGYLYQTVSREIDNLLPAGKTLTLNGNIYVNSVAQGRNWTMDGNGLSVVNGNIYNSATAANDPGLNSPLIKSGTGFLLLNGTGSTYRGATTVNGGLLQFASSGSYGVQLPGFTTPAVFLPVTSSGPPVVGTTVSYATGNTGTVSMTVATGGAVGVSTSSLDPNFLALFTASGTASTGGLALGSADAAANIDFTTGTMSGANLVGLSVGALSTGVTYTGTITPAAATYRLGGGGTLTLPNANALTSVNSLLAINGGTVALANSNNYSGSTTIKGVYVVSNANKAATNDFSGAGGAFMPQVLSVNHLANGGAITGSSIGSSSNAAANLLISGSTLRYTGTGDSTDRLFTMTPVGATLDSSGSGAVNFTNAGSIVQTTVAPLLATQFSAASGSGVPFNRANFSSSTDLSSVAIGMTVTDSANSFPAGTTVTGVDPTHLYVSFQPQTGAIANDTLTFTNQNRVLTLTGSNTGANTLAAALGDSTAGKLGISKTGAGTWFLSGTSTYTGNTTVGGGILEFTTAAAYGGTNSITAGPNGAVGLDTSSLNAAFLAKIAASSTPSTGALAVATVDAAANVDFTSSPLSGPNLVGMSVGAVSAGVTYTGTITPAASTYRVGGGGVLTLANTNALTGANAVVVTNSGAGVVLSGSNNYSGNTSVNSGTLTVAATGAITSSNNITVAAGATLNAIGSLPSTATVNSNGTTNFGGNTGIGPHTQTLAALNVGPGATASILSSTFPFTPATLHPAALSFANSTSKIDVNNNILIGPGTAAAALGLITGGQVVSSAGTANLGYIDAGGGTFEIRWTLLGDTNLDGIVNVSDLGNLATNFGSTSASWIQGDFDRNGSVNVADLGDLATNFGQSLAAGSSAGSLAAAAASSSSSVAAVPEPTTLTLIGLGAIQMVTRRRRRV